MLSNFIYFDRRRITTLEKANIINIYIVNLTNPLSFLAVGLNPYSIKYPTIRPCLIPFQRGNSRRIFFSYIMWTCAVCINMNYKAYTLRTHFVFTRLSRLRFSSWLVPFLRSDAYLSRVYNCFTFRLCFQSPSTCQPKKKKRFTSCTNP